MPHRVVGFTDVFLQRVIHSVILKNLCSNSVGSMVGKITERQDQYLSFIFHYIKVNSRSPAESDIQRYFNVSPPTVHQMVIKLESLGLIVRKAGVARSIQVLVSGLATKHYNSNMRAAPGLIPATPD